MITETTDNTREMPFEILAEQIISQVVTVPTEIDKGDFCWCRYSCAPVNLAFAGDNDLKSDQSSFLFKRIGASDTLIMGLEKDGVQVDALTDNTYGTFYDFGDLLNPLLSGYLLDWSLVYAAFGGGKYRIVSTLTIFTVNFTYNSVYYQLMAWNEIAADGTVRIESWQNGSIQSNPIDFTGLNWYSQYRIKGDFGNRQPEFITDNYLDSQRNIRQIQDQIQDTYKLELLNLSMEEKELILYRDFLANRLRFTDYNISNEDKYRPIEAYPESIEDVKYRIGQPGSSLIVKFRANPENQLKRNSF